MSFRYSQFGTGFSLAQPTADARRFGDFVEIRGQTITLVKLTETEVDEFGQSVYTETSFTDKAFVERDGGEKDLPPGTMKVGLLRLFMKLWATIDEEEYEVEVDGVRYHVTSVEKTRAYLEVEAERKVE